MSNSSRAARSGSRAATGRRRLRSQAPWASSSRPRLSFLIATGLAVLAAVIVALALRSQSTRPEPARGQPAAGGAPPAPPPAEPKLRER